jgi:maleate cis-trans isomerase
VNRAGAMFGWRALIGWIHSLAVISRTPQELQPLLPDGVGVLYSSLGKLDQSPEQTEKALSRLEEMAKFQALNGAEFIIANSSPMVTYAGPKAAHDVNRRLSEAAGCPATNTTTAAVTAMKAMGLSRIAVCSPYASQNPYLVHFLEAEGFDIRGEYGLDRSLWEIHTLPVEYTYKIARDTFRSAPGAQALYMAGGRLPVLEIVEDLEQDLGVPVIASTACTAWNALRVLGINAPRGGYGRLMAEFPELP